MEVNRRIILIGNYQPDEQESMKRFAQMLAAGFRAAGYASEIWYPTVLFSTGMKANSGLGKWLGYIDKWILYPFVMRWQLLDKSLQNDNVYFHVCDHSNAPYLRYLPSDRTGITCHDVLAIRGAMGHVDAYSPASSTGKVYQRWILHHLSRTKRLASVSEYTLTHLQELMLNRQTDQKNWRVIPNAFNAVFKPMKSRALDETLRGVGLKAGVPFLLHVGSGLLRKNRRLLLDMVAALGSRWNGYVCYAGQEVDTKLMAYAESLGVHDRVVSVVKPSHHVLVALYSGCEAFVFPSFSEGFGWPVIEAQACGAPVITSNLTAMPEVSGGAAIYADPAVPQSFADAFLTLKKGAVRADLIQRGFENVRRFEVAKVVKDYLALYDLK